MGNTSTPVNLDVIKARLGSISPGKRLRIATVSAAADKLLDDVRKLVDEVSCLRAEVDCLNALARED